MNRWFHILLLVALADYTSWCQPVVPTPETLYSDAGEFMYSGDYNDALDILLTLHKRGFQTANISYLIGECYLNVPGQKVRSINFLKEAAGNISQNYKGKSLDEEYAPAKALLYLGIAYRLNYDFDNALVSFNNYLKIIDDSDKDNRRTAEYHIERCNYARELIASPTKLSADTLSAGTGVSRFNPLAPADESSLVFMDKLKFYDAVMRTSMRGIDLTDPLNLTPEIRSDGDHYVTGISADGKLLLFTYYDPYRSGEIFASEYGADSWQPMHKLNSEINTVFNESHASVSADGNVLYFTSDRKGGYGGTDIYKSVRNGSGEWGKATNLGPVINTPYNEESPFVSTDGNRLFFSSQGHYNMGGFDIFFCSKDSTGNWLPPVNAGYPLNTTDDDLFFFPVKDGNSGYQSRYPENSSVSELVHFNILSFGNPERFMINGKVDVSNDPGFNKSNLKVTFVENDKKDTIAVRQLNDDGTFRQKLAAGNYKIDFSGPSSLLLSRNLSIPKYLPHNNLVLNEKVTVISPVTTDTVFLRDILFEFNTTNPARAYNQDIEGITEILTRFPEVTVIIKGYADAIGSDAFNQRLSMKRAESVKGILEDRFAKTLRISTLAFGEKNPVALNSNPDGSDNPEGRKYNRHVEVQFEGLPDTIHVIHINEIPEELRSKK